MNTLSIQSEKVLARAVQAIEGIPFTAAQAAVRQAAADEAKVAKALTVADPDRAHAWRFLVAAGAQAGVPIDDRYDAAVTPWQVEAVCTTCRSRVEVRDTYIAVRPAHADPSDPAELCGPCGALDNAELDPDKLPTRKLPDGANVQEAEQAAFDADLDRYLRAAGRPDDQLLSPVAGHTGLYSCADCATLHFPDFDWQPGSTGTVHLDRYQPLNDVPCSSCVQLPFVVAIDADGNRIGSDGAYAIYEVHTSRPLSGDMTEQLRRLAADGSDEATEALQLIDLLG